ncbi:MAG: ROK family protein [Clostridiaceae bacterium]|nr:ROK family protein [Eubacteriales bacterium]
MFRIGFDVGGTNIAAGLLNESLDIVQRRNVPFSNGKGGEYIASVLAQLVRDLTGAQCIGAKELECIGVAVPGSIDRRGEFVIDAYNLQFHNVPLRSQLQVYFPEVPVFLANDANAAALAELHKGAFAGCKTAVLMTLGTGVGGGIILNGKMFNGGNGNGVELGHSILSHNGELCSCGVHGCVEAYCTASWFVRQGRKAVVEYKNSMIYTSARGSMDNVTAKLVVDCAKEGDHIALDIFDRYVDALGSAVTSMVNILDPEVIALGGGVSLAGDFLFEPLRENVRKKVFFPAFGRIVPAQTGNDAGVIGAAMLKVNAE